MNLIVLCVDSWRADILGEQGACRWIQAPVLADLARQSVSFDRAFGEAMPTVQMRRAFFTGMRGYPWHHDLDGLGLSPAFLGWHRVPTSQTTLAEILLHRGYCTGLITDCYHLFKPTQNFTRGFLSWQFIRGQQGDNYRVGPYRDIDISPYVPDGEEHDWATNAQIVNHLVNTRSRKGEDDYFAPQVFRAAMDWVRDAHANAPFVLWVDSFMPHELWDPPARYADAYFPNDGTLKDFIHPGVTARVPDLSPAQVERTKALYAGCCTLVDTWIGHLLEVVESLNLLDDTIVMFLTDHGLELYDHGAFTKRGAHNQGKLHAYNTQITWMIRHPDGPRGLRVPGFVQAHDLVPTVLELLNLPPCELLDGGSAWPLACGRAESLRDRVVIGWGPWVSVRDARWNCILNPTTHDGAPRLFDLADDPGESRDVAGEYPQVIADCRRHVEGLIGQPFPVRYNHQPDAGDYMTLSSYFRRRAKLGHGGAHRFDAPGPAIPHPKLRAISTEECARSDEVDRISA
jgi:arylsulfatase A-like enzyme